MNSALIYYTTLGDLNACSILVYRAKACPFAKIHGCNAFEIAVRTKNLAIISMFINHWATLPSWNLHHEIYKLDEQRNLEILTYVNNLLATKNHPHTLVKHLLNVLHIAILLAKN